LCSVAPCTVIALPLAGRRRAVVADQPVEHRLLVGEAELAGPLQHQVLVRVGRVDEAGLLGPTVQDLVLAAQGGHQIGGTEHPGVVEEEHRLECPTPL